MKKYKDFLIRNGFDVSIVGSNYFIDLMDEIVGKLRDNYDVLQIKELFPAMCLEYYHFYYEVSRFKFLEELDYFSKNGYVGDSEVEKNLWNEPVFNKLIRFGNKYLQECKDAENGKTFSKKINCKVLNVFG